MSILDLFKPKKPKQDPLGNYSKLVALIDQSFTSNEKAELNSCFVNGVLAHSEFMSEISPTVYSNKIPERKRSGLNYLMQMVPNPSGETAPSFWKRVTTAKYMNNYALIYVERDTLDLWTPKALWLLDETNDLVAGRDRSGKAWYKFRLNDGTYYVPSNDMIMLSREASLSTLLAGRSKALDQVIRVIDTSYKGLDKAVQQSILLRFLVQGATVYTDDEMSDMSVKFSDLFSGKTSAAFLGAGDKITEVQSQGKWPLAPEISGIESHVHEYLGITPAIEKGDFTEAQWTSYFARSIRPSCVQLATELTTKLLTPDEYFKGKNVSIVTEGMESLTPSTGLKKVETKLKFPVVVPNDLRQDMGEDPIEGGDEPQTNLNWVKTKDQTAYQGGESDLASKGEDDDATK